MKDILNMNKDQNSTTSPIILNIGLQESDALADVGLCTVRLYRTHNLDNIDMSDQEREDFGEETLEADSLTLLREEWKGKNGNTMNCLCTTLEIDPAWVGQVRLEVITDKGSFQSEAHLHKGLNSFFFAESRLIPPAKAHTRLKPVIITVASVIIAVAVIAGLWIMFDSFHQSNSTATDSIVDTNSVETTATDTMPMTSQPANEDTETSPAVSYTPSAHIPANYGGEYNDPTEDADNLPAEPPRKEKYYGIEP